jgi:hypothetical protein
MENDVIETQAAKIWLEEDGIVWTMILPIVFPDDKLTIADARNIIEGASKLTNGKKTPMLVESSYARPMNSEAKEFLTGMEAANVVSALAMITSSSLNKLLRNVLLGINKPSYPVKLFTSEAEAINWLKRFLE